MNGTFSHIPDVEGLAETGGYRHPRGKSGACAERISQQQGKEIASKKAQAAFQNENLYIRREGRAWPSEEVTKNFHQERGPTHAFATAEGGREADERRCLARVCHPGEEKGGLQQKKRKGYEYVGGGSSR